MESNIMTVKFLQRILTVIKNCQDLQQHPLSTNLAH